MVTEEYKPRHDKEVVFEVSGGPDNLGRYAFTAFWEQQKAYCHTCGRNFPCGDPTHASKTNAQVFFADAAAHERGWIERGYEVRIIDRRTWRALTWKRS